MKSIYKHKVVRIPIYTGNLFILLTNNPEKLPEEAQDSSIDLHAMSFMNEHKKRVAFYVVYNFWGVSKIYHGVIAHEIRHCVDTIANYHGLETTNINEHLTYLTGWITDEVYKFILSEGIKIHVKN